MTRFSPQLQDLCDAVEDVSTAELLTEIAPIVTERLVEDRLQLLDEIDRLRTLLLRVLDSAPITPTDTLKAIKQELDNVIYVDE